MFLRKLFKVGDKLRWLVLELVIVFIGVYLAFLFQSYNEQKKQDREKEKVYSALKYELEYFRTMLPGRSTHMRGVWRDLRKEYQAGEYSDFSDWRFIEPQYEYKIVEYAISSDNTELVDFRLYNQLQRLYSTIKRLEHAERLMMTMAQRYKPLPTKVPDAHPEVRTRIADNYHVFGRLILFMRDRANNLALVARESAKCLETINQLMDPETRKKVETELLSIESKDYDDEQRFVERAIELFPDFTESELKSIYQQAH